jgi:hypothetical protein
MKGMTGGRTNSRAEGLRKDFGRWRIKGGKDGRRGMKVKDERKDGRTDERKSGRRTEEGEG